MISEGMCSSYLSYSPMRRSLRRSMSFMTDSFSALAFARAAASWDCAPARGRRRAGCRQLLLQPVHGHVQVGGPLREPGPPPFPPARSGPFRLEELKQISDWITVMRDGRYVDTVPTAGVTIDKIILMMVGRTIDESAPEVPENPSREVVLEVKGRRRGRAIQDVSFKLYKGEILGFAGLVGAGRTEVARAIFGADPLEGGQIEVGGKKVERPFPQGRGAARNCLPFGGPKARLGPPGAGHRDEPGAPRGARRRARSRPARPEPPARSAARGAPRRERRGARARLRPRWRPSRPRTRGPRRPPRRGCRPWPRPAARRGTPSASRGRSRPGGAWRPTTLARSAPPRERAARRRPAGDGSASRRRTRRAGSGAREGGELGDGHAGQRERRGELEADAGPGDGELQVGGRLVERGRGGRGGARVRCGRGERVAGGEVRDTDRRPQGSKGGERTRLSGEPAAQRAL